MLFCNEKYLTLIISETMTDTDYLTLYFESSCKTKYCFIIQIRSCHHTDIKTHNNFIKIIFIFAYGI